METAKANAVKEFKDSHAFIDSCAEYYGTGFEDCLKQVALSFPYLDLFGITMDAPIPSTPVGDAVVDESDDSIEPDLPPKDDGVVLVNQDGCRGWRHCIPACPYKKIYYN